MTLARINPERSTMKAGKQETSARHGRNHSTTGRVLAVAAFLALPLVGATAATASATSPQTSTGHATQQQFYLDGLERAAREGAAGAPAARAAFAAQQRAHFGYLDQAGPTAQAALAAQQRSHFGYLDAAAPTGRAAFAAQQRSYVEHLAQAAPATRAALAAQQRSYVEHLAALGSPSDAPGVQSASSNVPGDTGDGVSIPVAALLTLGGIALGTGTTVASRRLPHLHLGRSAG